MIDKKTLRQEIRRMKGQLLQDELQQLSLDICYSLLTHPRVKDAQTIIAYHALADEVNTAALLSELTSSGKRILLPKVISDTEMTLHDYTSPDDVTPGAYGIMEPTTPAVPVDTLYNIEGIVGIIPGMAFDCNGHRLGRGKGYYDRMLAALPHLYRIGICFPFQLLDSIPSAPHDIIMHEVISC